MIAPDTVSRLILDRCAPIPGAANKAERRLITTARRALEDAATYSANTMPALTSPESVETFAAPLIGNASQELVLVIPTDSRMHLAGDPLIATVGDVDGADAGPRVVFRHAIAQNATGVIVCHNHPTGNDTASPNDKAITKRLAEAGRIIGIALHDHLIIPKGGAFVSLRRTAAHLFGGA